MESASSRDDLPTPFAPIKTVKGRSSRSTSARRRNPRTVRLRKRCVELSTLPSSLNCSIQGQAASRIELRVEKRRRQGLLVLFVRVAFCENGVHGKHLAVKRQPA